MSDKDYKITLKFKTPTYGEIDNIKLANALVDLSFSLYNSDEVLNLFKQNKLHISSIINAEKKEEIMNNFMLIRKKKAREVNDSLDFLEKAKKIKDILKGKEVSERGSEDGGSVTIENYDVRIKNMIHRVTGFSDNIFFHTVKYNNKSHIYINTDENKIELLVDLLRDLGYIGVSKRRSIGYGKFRIANVEEIDSNKEFEELFNISSSESYLHLFGKYPFDDVHLKNVDLTNSFYNLSSFYGRFRDGYYFGNYLLITEFSSLHGDQISNIVKEFNNSENNTIIFAPYIVKGD